MHGLIFRTVEAFVTDGYGPEAWTKAIAQSGLDVTSFEAMLQYDASWFTRLLDGCAQVLDRSQWVILEDIGTYLITRQHHASIRRLMRFGGDTFSELLHSLDDLPDRTRLAVTDLDLPRITVRETFPLYFTLNCRGHPMGFGYVLVGLLRAMADDYGTLAVVDHCGVQGDTEVISVRVVETAFARDRGFSLTDPSKAELA